MGKKRRRSGKEMLIPDPLLLSRLNKYLESKRHEAAIDQNKMVEDLRSTYKEYEKKDKTAFRAGVFRAYNYILQPLVNPSSLLVRNDEDLSSLESCSDDEEILDSDDLLDDVQVLNPKDGLNRNNGSTPYLKNLQSMTNASNRCNGRQGANSDADSTSKEKGGVMDAINISSDDDDDEVGGPQPQTVSSQGKVPSGGAGLLPTPTTTTIRTLELPFQQMDRSKGTLNSRILNIGSNPISISLVPKQSGTPSRSGVPVTPFKRKSATPLQPTAKRRREDLVPVQQVPKLRLKDFGGHNKIYESLSCLFQHMSCPEVYTTLGISPPLGFLLHGPPGSGKTLLAHCIAGELEMPLVKVAGPELVSGISGESEERMRSLFQAAIASAPCVLFIDEIESISQPRESASKDMERRIVAQLLACFDDLQSRESENLVVVIGATNRADSLDPGLRRAGRFDREIPLGMPDRDTRLEILRLVTDSLRLSPSLDLSAVAEATPGYVGADLRALATQAAYQAVTRYMKFKDEVEMKIPIQQERATDEAVIIEEEKTDEKSSGDNLEGVNKGEEENKEAEGEKTDGNEEKNKNGKSPRDVAAENTTAEERVLVDSDSLGELYIEETDFTVALKTIQPSAKREGFATVPDVTWSDVGSLQNIREQLNLSIMMPVKYPEEFARLGVTSPTGVLLCGPPGCGKTLLAKAVANEASINFISVKGPELLNMYVGESERAVRQVFQRARSSQPCVIFFDEIDALCPKRSDSAEGGGRAGSRVVNQLLTEMDGVEGGRTGVYMMAATNRPDMLDPAILRPGRFDKILYVGLPSPRDRALVLKALTKNGTRPELTSDVDLDAVGSSESCDGFSGADLAALVKEASIEALSEYIRNSREGQLRVSAQHITSALTRIRPSVSSEERIRYEAYRLLYSPVDPTEDRMEEDD